MISVVFENEHFVVCDKPSGVLTTPSRHAEEDPRTCLGTALQSSLGLQIYPVHRLDFEVSGLVLFAKSAAAHRDGNAWFEHKKIQKTYRAWTTEQSFAHIPANIPSERKIFSLTVEQEFNWESRQLRGKRRSYLSPEGKQSQTKAKFLRLNEKKFLEWDLEPITGRPHQLRLDLSRHGFPIVGDKLYGSQAPWAFQSIALRAYKIDFSNVPKGKSWGLPPQIEVIAL